MNNKIIGIESSVNPGVIKIILNHYSVMYDEFYILQCSKIHSKEMLLPEDTYHITVDGQYLRDVAQSTVWELVMYIYPEGITGSEIGTYEDFLESECNTCVIYYDCGYLEIYSKDEEHLFAMHKILSRLDTDELTFVTEENFDRTAMHL
ncbi:MAG: DUF2691 family protein [Eubacteriaceae bacterium]|nr:DUF2691 family protein [Eubacteriaceae bacterium]